MSILTAHRARLATVGALVATLSFAALPAHAAQTVETTTTFEVTAAGGLAVTAPTGPVNLGPVANDGTKTTSLGEVKASDTRGLLATSYTTSVTSTEFTTTVTNPDLTTTVVNFGNANVTYNSGLTGTATGTVTCTGTGVPLGLDATRTAMAATLASGTSSCAWNPAITVTPPTSAVVGTYTGTITHSVI